MTLPFDGRFAAWIAVAAVLIVTPGPDTAVIIRNALRAGARSAFAYLGIPQTIYPPRVLLAGDEQVLCT